MVGVLGLSKAVLATTCPSATLIPAVPTLPYTQSLVCGVADDMNAGTIPVCGSTVYYGGLESVYTWTPVIDYSGVTIAYSGQSWSGIFLFAGCPTSGGTCVANITGSGTAKTLVVPGTLTAGVQYFIMFDTWPAPASPCPGSFTLNGTPNLATPPTPTQAPGVPSCLAGTTIDVVGTPATDVEWYWQTTPGGTDMTDLYAGPYTIFANGTYYLRAYHTIAGIWSTPSSVNVTNFPTATTPPAPTADINPSCVTTGSVLTAAVAPGGTEYYWQETNSTGSSTALPATATYAVGATGTYYLAAYETATGCWSATSSIAVTVDTYVPAAPVASPDAYFICSGATTQPANATVANSDVVTVTSGPISVLVPDNNTTGITTTLTTSGIPSAATVTSFSVNFTATHTWDSDLNLYLIGPNAAVVDLTSGNGGSGDNFTNTTFSSAGVTPITAGVAPFTGTYLPEGNFSTLYSQLNGTWTLFAFDNAGGDVGTILNWTITINYSLPLTTMDWYDAATSGINMGSGSPFETVGSAVIGTPAPAGIYSFFVEAVSGACVSTDRTEVTVSVTDVTVTLNPVSVTCNNGNDGSFTLGAVQCGTAPFTYSVDGGAFGAIPTDLTVGPHSVIVQDAGAALSGTYTVTVGDAPAPTGLTVNGFTNDIVDLSWTAGGTETAWHVEWGFAGFIPGTGAEVGSANANAPSYSVSGLDGFTDYDFYVAADCGSGTTAGTWVLISQTTLCDPLVAQAFCESFDSDSPTQDCWTVKNVNGDADAWNMNSTFNMYSGDEGAALLTDGNGGANDDWLISPMLTLTNNEILSFYFRVQSSGEPNNFEVLLSTTGMDPADFTEVLMPNTTYYNTTYADSIVDLSAYSGDCYIAFHVPNGGLDGWYLFVDQFCVDICIPDPGVDGATDVCRLDNTLDLNPVITAGEPNGVWEFLPNPGVVSGSDLNISLMPDGTYDVSYIVTTACTMDTTIATVTIHPASSAGNDGTLDDYCTNWMGINLVDGLSGSLDLGGTWTNVSGEGTLVGNQWNPAVTTLAGAYDFEYVVNNGFCPNDTSNITVNLISCLGLDDASNWHLAVYPNPVSDVLTLSNLDIDNGVVEVLDVQGKLIQSIVLNGVYGNYLIDMTEMQRGVYVLRVSTENATKEVRVIKQ